MSSLAQFNTGHVQDGAFKIVFGSKTINKWNAKRRSWRNVIHGGKLWNTLPTDLKNECSIVKFQSRVRDIYVE